MPAEPCLWASIFSHPTVLAATSVAGLKAQIGLQQYLCWIEIQTEPTHTSAGKIRR
jgi:hypothetical protein